VPVSFHSPPHAGRGRGGRVALLLPAAAKPEQLICCAIWGWNSLCKQVPSCVVGWVQAQGG